MALVGDGALRGLDPYSAHVLDLRRGLLRDLHPYWPLPWRPTATRHDSSPGGRTRAWAQADAGACAGGGSGGRRRRRPPHSFPGCARRDRPRRSAADPSDTALQPDSPTAPDSNERFQHFCVTMRHRTADTSPSVLREATTYIDDKAGTVGCASS